jgi:iron complex outermembrane receptor protein
MASAFRTAILLATNLITHAALGQAVNAQQNATAYTDTGFGDIIVSARRREERLQDVPIAVTAIAGDDLNKQSVTQITDLSRVVPGLSATAGGFGGGVPRFNIRSQVQFEQLITLDPSVGIYFADVAQARAHGTNAAFFDLASVEVLKGPQGTLFGRNTTGGAIVITPKAPTDALGGYIDATLGNYATRIVSGALNIPLSGETLALRLSGRIAKHDGYTYSPYAHTGFDDENSQSWRASLLWKPTDSLRNLLIVNGYHAREHGTAFRLTNVLPGSTFATKAPQLLTYLADIGDRRLAGNEDPDSRTLTRTIGISNTTTLDVAGVTLKNIFGYRHVKNSNNLDFDGSPFFIYVAPESIDEQQYSDEVQLLGKAFDDKLNWIVGGYYFRETGSETQRSTITVVPQDIIRTGSVRNESKSLFAQGTYDLGFVEGLSVTAGARYTWDDRSLQQVGFNLLANTCLSTVATLPTCLSPEFSKSFHALTYTVNLDWKFAPNQLIYVAHRRGYRSGGFNLRANTPAQFRPFDPEYVKDVEVGLKADWDIGGTKLRTNIAGYYQWYSDIQRSITFVDPATGILTVSVVNAATAHVAGFEGEFRWLPIPNVEVSGNVAHSALRYSSFNQALAGGAVQDLSANRIGFSPEWTGGGSIRVTHPLIGSAGSLALQGDIYAQSKMQLADINVPFGTAAGYTTLNFRLEWNGILNTGISAAGYLRNATNRNYFNGGFAIAGLGPIAKQYGQPRTFGIEVHVPFGQ